MTGKLFSVIGNLFPVTGNKFPVTKNSLYCTGKISCDMRSSFFIPMTGGKFPVTGNKFLVTGNKFPLSQEEQRSPHVTGKIFYYLGNTLYRLSNLDTKC